MTAKQFKQLQREIEVVRMVIKKLTDKETLDQREVYQLGMLLAGSTNKFLTEMMWRESMRKGDDGKYIHTDAKEDDHRAVTL